VSQPEAIGVGAVEDAAAEPADQDGAVRELRLVVGEPLLVVRGAVRVVGRHDGDPIGRRAQIELLQPARDARLRYHHRRGELAEVVADREKQATVLAAGLGCLAGLDHVHGDQRHEHRRERAGQARRQGRDQVDRHLGDVQRQGERERREIAEDARGRVVTIEAEAVREEVEEGEEDREEGEEQHVEAVPAPEMRAAGRAQPRRQPARDDLGDQEADPQVGDRAEERRLDVRADEDELRVVEKQPRQIAERDGIRRGVGRDEGQVLAHLGLPEQQRRAVEDEGCGGEARGGAPGATQEIVRGERRQDVHRPQLDVEAEPEAEREQDALQHRASLAAEQRDRPEGHEPAQVEVVRPQGAEEDLEGGGGDVGAGERGRQRFVAAAHQ